MAVIISLVPAVCFTLAYLSLSSAAALWIGRRLARVNG